MSLLTVANCSSSLSHILVSGLVMGYIHHCHPSLLPDDSAVFLRHVCYLSLWIIQADAIYSYDLRLTPCLTFDVDSAFGCLHHVV
jgi:hypothetical protein